MLPIIEVRDLSKIYASGVQALAGVTFGIREGEILTIIQVAEYLKVTQRTIYRLAAAKKIPAFKVGGTWRFSLADIDSWIKQQSMEGLDTGRESGGEAGEQI